ncbi:MAG: hypothetical protein LUD51_03590 [Clostridia bacterium]|nr:hypothetical protein [Clostridia bacterium]
MSKQTGKTEPKKQATLEVIARITDADGTVVEKITSSIGFPSTDDFDLETREGFLNDFDPMEKAGLEGREAIPQVCSEYLEVAASKKKPKKEDE